MEEPRREAEVGVEGGRVLTGVLGVRGGLEVRGGCKGSGQPNAAQWK